MVVVVMGVCGSGKTTVGRALAEALGVAFYDGDDFHSAANVAKMASGQALTDEDRWPWLDTIAAAMPGWAQAGGAVVACSALKRVYRDRLRAGLPGGVGFIWLDADAAVLRGRLGARPGHFMAAGMLDGQLATLEPPTGESDVARVWVEATVQQAVADAAEAVVGLATGKE